MNRVDLKEKECRSKIHIDQNYSFISFYDIERMIADSIDDKLKMRIIQDYEHLLDQDYLQTLDSQLYELNLEACNKYNRELNKSIYHLVNLGGMNVPINNTTPVTNIHTDFQLKRSNSTNTTLLNNTTKVGLSGDIEPTPSKPAEVKIQTVRYIRQKPFKCPTKGCKKKFSANAYLIQHYKICNAREGSRKSSRIKCLVGEKKKKKNLVS